MSETSEFAHKTISISIEQELKQSYLDYAMSVIVGRALPDVRDGLKPVHRRVLFAMHVLNNDYNKPYKKSARVVGDVIGKYHPHGETAVYDAIVRMAQHFSMRYMLIDGQGNFGSVDGDSAAAMRYTEIRMSRLTHELIDSLEKNTVNFLPNYDNSEYAPEVFPAKYPNILVNGTSGIAVGMATNIPPHNITEILNATIALIDEPSAELDTLMSHVSGPDFPTAALINGRSGIISAYKTGRGKIHIRAKMDFETNKQGKNSVIIHELPFQVNKARLLEKIGYLVKNKKLEGITAIRDESDKRGMRVVLEVRRDINPELLINQLYKSTQCQVVFGINMVVLHRGQPKCMNIKEIIQAFIVHRQEVVTRRTQFDLQKARSRAHILEGLAVSLSHIDAIVTMIKAAKTRGEAYNALLDRQWDAQFVVTMLKDSINLTRPDDLESQYGLFDSSYQLSPVQANAILDLRLHRLTALEREKIDNEYKELVEKIVGFLNILDNFTVLMALIKEELQALIEKYGDERKTEIIDHIDLADEDLIPRHDVVVTISQHGYTKIQEISTYQSQRRGGCGKQSAQMKEADYIKFLEIAHTHDTLLLFTSRGKVYWKKVYQLPLAGRNANGRPIVNFIPLDKDEVVTAMLPVAEFSNDRYIIMCTKHGQIKKVTLTSFARPRTNGVIAIDLKEGDQLMAASLTNGQQDLMIFSNAGKVIRFNESKVRAMGRTARGVRAIRLASDQHVISLIVVDGDNPILTATQHGFGKRTELDQYRMTNRGGQGVISIQVSARNGHVIAAMQINDEQDIILISNTGLLVRIPANQVSIVGRNTQGVRLISLTKKAKLIDAKPVDICEEPDDTQAMPDDDSINTDQAIKPFETNENSSSQIKDEADSFKSDTSTSNEPDAAPDEDEQDIIQQDTTDDSAKGD